LSAEHNPIDITALKNYFLGLQERITSAMSTLHGKAFISDEWHKPEDSKLKGYGRTCILDGGNILEKGGVGFSHVHGDQMPASASHHRPEVAGRSFRGAGSLFSVPPA
jgi:coproporphyrinogen III oxidase